MIYLLVGRSIDIEERLQLSGLVPDMALPTHDVPMDITFLVATWLEVRAPCELISLQTSMNY